MQLTAFYTDSFHGVLAMYLPRALETQIRRTSEIFPVVLVTGPRQVGKTTVLQEIAEPGRAYYDLDDPETLELARTDPYQFFQKHPPPMILDEIQVAPQLLKHIKVMVDRDRRPGQFWLTGSQQFHMMKGVTESLAGRVGILDLFGMSQRELDGRAADVLPFLPRSYEEYVSSPVSKASGDLFARIWQGSFPAALALDETGWKRFFESYMRTYLQRDVRDLLNVGDLLSFEHFMRALAARTGQLLNLAECARDAGIAPNTAKSWLSVLVASGIVLLLEPYHTNLTKRFVKTPKMYLLDTGLCSYLTGWLSPMTLERGAMAGAMFETHVVSEVLKSYSNAGEHFPGHFYRDHGQREIDLVLHRNGTLYPIEIKKTASPHRESVSAFSSLDAFGMPIGPGAMICLADRIVPLSANVTAIPVSMV